MKRFFQPVQKDASFKKPALSSHSSMANDSEPKTETEKTNPVSDDDSNKTLKKEPTKFLTWNANSFLLRIKNNWLEFTKFIDSIDPDIIAIQVSFLPFIFFLC